jgi:hypothetical protein
MIGSTLATLSADDALEINLRSKESCIATFALFLCGAAFFV